MRLAWLLAALGLAACGHDETPPAPTSTAPPGLEALAALEDSAALDAALVAWPVTSDGVDPDTARTVLTWRLQRRAAAGEVEAAHDDLETLRAHFDGVGRTPEGRRLPEDLLAEGLAEAALDAARARIEGGDPDPAGAAAALDLASQLDEGELEDRIEAQRRWCQAGSAAELGLQLPAPTPAAPRAVLLVDTFAVQAGSPLAPQWARWRARSPDASLDVVPLARGFTMQGVRRAPGATREQEVDAIRGALDGSASTFHDAIDGATFARHMGLPATSSMCLLLAADGSIVARLAGAQLDLQRVEGAWLKLLGQ